MTFIPDAPRVAEQGFPPSFDWKFLPAKFYDTQMKNSTSEMNLNGLNGNVVNGMKASSSAFEILRNSTNDLREEEPEAEPEPEPEEVVVRRSAKKVSRPRTFM